MIDCPSFVFFKSLYQLLLHLHGQHIHLVLFEVHSWTVMKPRRADRAIKGSVYLWGLRKNCCFLLSLSLTQYFLSLWTCFHFVFTSSAIVTRAFTETRRNESSKNKLSSDCQKNIYWRRWLPSLLPLLRMTSVYPGRALIPHTPHRTPAGNGFVLQGPWGARSRGWRPSRAGPLSHGQLLRSRRVSEGKTWTWNDPTKQSPPWVHPQAKAPVPLTPKFSCSSLFLDLFFQLDQYIFQKGITPSLGTPVPSCLQPSPPASSPPSSSKSPSHSESPI